MSVYLTRNPQYGGTSNTAAPSANAAPQYQFYEKTYTTGTTQEWIYFPDRIFPVGIMLTPASGTQNIDLTMSPPDVIEAGNAVVTKWTAGAVAAGTAATLTGYTAFRVVIVTGTGKISACA